MSSGPLSWLQFGGSNRNKHKPVKINWREVETEADLDELIKSSESSKVLLFKHSNRCGISSTALNRLEKSWETELNSVPTFIIDVVRNRKLSQMIADRIDIPHQSPQILILKNSDCIYSESHMGIRYDEIKDLIDN